MSQNPKAIQLRVNALFHLVERAVWSALGYKLLSIHIIMLSLLHSPGTNIMRETDVTWGTQFINPCKACGGSLLENNREGNYRC